MFTNPSIRLNLALAYYKAARLPEATEGFQAVLAADPSNKQAILLLGDTLLQGGQFQQVVDTLTPHQEEFAKDLGFACGPRRISIASSAPATPRRRTC